MAVHVPTPNTWNAEKQHHGSFDLVPGTEGTTLEKRERNGRDDSDYYALYWDEESGTIKEYEYDTTRFPAWGYANVDATPEVIEKAQNYRRQQAIACAVDQDKKDAKRVDIMGREVKVVLGRKVPQGTQGRVCWIGSPQSYSPSRWAKPVTRVGIQCTDGTKHYTASTNCEVVDPEQHETPREKIEARFANYLCGSFVNAIAVSGYVVW